jgi:hypothetical protein
VYDTHDGTSLPADKNLSRHIRRLPYIGFTHNTEAASALFHWEEIFLGKSGFAWGLTFAECNFTLFRSDRSKSYYHYEFR